MLFQLCQVKQRVRELLPRIYRRGFYLKNLFSKHYPSTLWNDVIYYVPFLCKSNRFH